MIQSFLDMFAWVLSFLKIPLLFIAALLVILLLFVAGFFLSHLAKGEKLPPSGRNRVKQTGLIRKIFWEAPRQFVDDLFSRESGTFGLQGLIIYTGEQGAGKTISMVRDMLLIQDTYPNCRFITNFGYRYQNRALTDWKQLLTYNNGKYGVCVGIDEIQNWFSSKQSKEFPPEMFEVITQNRKNRRTILATTQNFYQPSKDIRAQCKEVRKCLTIFNVFTIVRRQKPIFDASGEVKEWKRAGRTYCFVHSPRIRNAYDTYRVIESLAKSGFKERNRVGV